jgi:hypothetical protein
VARRCHHPGIDVHVGVWEELRMSVPAAGGANRGRRLVLVGVLIAAIIAIGYIAFTVLGSQAQEEQRGTVEFGTGGAGCDIEGRSSSFPSGVASIYEVAHLAREVRAAEVVTFRISLDGRQVASVPRTFDASGDCFGGTLPGELLTRGRYRVEYLVGAEPLASGEFDIVP